MLLTVAVSISSVWQSSHFNHLAVPSSEQHPFLSTHIKPNKLLHLPLSSRVWDSLTLFFFKLNGSFCLPKMTVFGCFSLCLLTFDVKIQKRHLYSSLGTTPSFSQTKPATWALPWYRPLACITHHIWLASLSSSLLNSYLLLLTDLSKCPSLRQFQIFYHTHWSLLQNILLYTRQSLIVPLEPFTWMGTTISQNLQIHLKTPIH